MEDESIVRDVHAIKNTLTTFGVRLELVYNSLVGNEIAKDGGLVGDIIEQKKEIHDLKRRVYQLEKKESQRMIYVNIMWGAAASIATLIIHHFLK